MHWRLFAARALAEELCIGGLHWRNVGSAWRCLSAHWRQGRRHGRMHKATCHQRLAVPSGMGSIGVSTSLLQFKAPYYAAVVSESLPLHRTYPEPEVRASIDHSASVALPPCHAICKKRRPNVAPVVGGSATHAGGNRQYGASIVRIVRRHLVLQFSGSKIQCILTLRTIAC